MGRIGQADETAMALYGLAEEAGLTIAPHLISALTLIQRSAAFEGDGDLAAAHLVLRDVLQDLEELRERAEGSIRERDPGRQLAGPLLDFE